MIFSNKKNMSRITTTTTAKKNIWPKFHSVDNRILKSRWINLLANTIFFLFYCHLKLVKLSAPTPPPTNDDDDDDYIDNLVVVVVVVVWRINTRKKITVKQKNWCQIRWLSHTHTHKKTPRKTKFDIENQLAMNDIDDDDDNFITWNLKKKLSTK